MNSDIANYLLVDKKYISLKFSFLEDYNDPYEFFLSIDYNQSPEILAFYREVINMTVKAPATCFYRSPFVTPMWAHYANNSNGFVLEIDEKYLGEYLTGEGKDHVFNNVEYKDEVSKDINELLHRAYALQKPRYMHFLENYIFLPLISLKKHAGATRMKEDFC